MMLKHGKLALLIPWIGIFFLSGCASNSLFTGHPARLDSVISDLMAGKQPNPSLFEKNIVGRDRTLYLMERGRTRQMIGDNSGSRADFNAAIEAISRQDDQAVISASKGVEQTGGMMLNDNAISYRVAGHERVLLRYFQSINYLLSNDLEGGRVEIANADHEQMLAMEKHEKEIKEANEQRKRKKEASGFFKTFDNVNAKVAQQYAGLDAISGKVRNSFQNGAAYYLSGIIYESLGDVNNAYISYKRVLELFPENTVIQKDAVRLAHLDSRAEELAAFKSRFGFSDDDMRKLVEPAGYGRLVVVYETGFVAQKQEIKIPVPIIGGERLLSGVSFIAFPIYEAQWESAAPLWISYPRGNGSTESVCDVNAMAVKSLKEKLPAILVRQTIRFVAKTAVTKAASDRMGVWGALVASAASAVTERADLRSWLTLPESIQIYRIGLDSGIHSFEFKNAAGNTRKLDIEIKAGETSFVHVIDTKKLYIRSANL